MKVTVFTSNQPRHLSLLERFASFAEVVYGVVECNTIFPGKLPGFFNKSAVMQQYFSEVIRAEKKIFGEVRTLPSNVRTIAMQGGDLDYAEREQLQDVLDSDLYVVFGASWIRGWLIDFLISQQALNIHMGVSPYYRGSSCNFWALYDERFDLVGATIHNLAKGLDSGAMLYHAVPGCRRDDTPFDYTMRAVLAAHESLGARIRDGSIWDLTPIEQDRSKEIRYTKNAAFNDDIASEFLDRHLTGANIVDFLEKADRSRLLHEPYVAA